MKVNFYAIPARQALAQNIEPKEQAEVIAPGLDGKVLVKFEDGTLESVPASHLQELDLARDLALRPALEQKPAKVEVKKPAVIKKPAGSKKSV